MERLEDRSLLSAGALDPTFGLGGIVTTDFLGSNTDAAQAVALQNDGKIVVAGHTRDANQNTDFVVTRYNADGTLDAAFGSGGRVVTDLQGNGGSDNARGIAIDWMGRIVVAGQSGQGFAVVRYLGDGSLDATFGGDGIVTTDLGGGSAFGEDVAFDNVGRIIVGGYSHQSGAPDVAVVRYFEDGTLDAGFGSGGIVTADFGGANDFAFGVAVDAANRIVTAGYSLVGLAGPISSTLLVVRFDAAGALDSTFDGDGWAATDLAGTTERLNDLLIDADGRIVAAGGWNGDFIVARYTSTGALDTSFGGGVASTDFGRHETANSLTLDHQGRIVVAGNSGNDSQWTAADFALARYNAVDGSLDSTFDGDGKAVTDFGGGLDRGEGVLFDGNGRIVVAGVAGIAGTNSSDLALARYVDSGALDAGFGGDGLVTTDLLGSSTDRVEGLARQSDGKLVVAGTVQDSVGTGSYVARYGANGNLDPGFGVAGRVAIDFGGVRFEAREVLIDAAGRIIVVGRAEEDFALIAFDSSGVLDTSFGSSGRLTTDFNNGSEEYPSSAVLDAQGRIVVAGYGYDTVLTNDGLQPDFLLARYNSDGTLDSTFGTGGKVVTDFTLRSDIAMDVTIDSQGRIVVAGYAYMGSTPGFDFAVARYLENGTLDATFSTDGRATVHLPDGGQANDFGWGVAVDGTDRIVVAGRTNTSVGFDDFALVRFNANGTLDTTFDADGIVITDFSGGGSDLVGTVTIDAVGKILVAGAAQTGGSFRDFTVARYNPDGTLDATFGNGGWSATDIGGLPNSTDWASEILVQPDGRIVAAGYADMPASDHDFALVRYAGSAGAVDTIIEGIDFDENGANDGAFYSIPPDPHGAAGLSHVVSVVNRSIEWHTKTGTQQNSQSLQSFFAPLGPVNRPFDPKVIYDQYGGRFIVVALERDDTAQASRILVAVSDDGDPNGTWHYHAIDSMMNIDGNNTWADYPGLAVDDEAIYITNNMFTFGSPRVFEGVRLWIIGKGTGGGLYSGGAASVTVHDPYANGGISQTTQPVHTFGTTPGGTGTWLVSYGGLSQDAGTVGGTGNESVSVIHITNPLSAPNFAHQLVDLGNIETVWTTEGAFIDVPDAPQLGSSRGIETNDRRALNAVWRDGSIYLATTILPDDGPNAGQATAYWVRIDTDAAGVPQAFAADQGEVGGEDIAVGTHTFFPSIAVDGDGNIAIGFSASGPSIYAGAYFTGRLASDPAGTTRGSQVLAAGEDFYVRTFGDPRNRWGDYTGTIVDPSDDSTFWVFNQYARTRGTVLDVSGEDGRWGTRWGSFTLTTPDPNLPIAADDSFATDEDVSLVVTAPGVLANDSDPNGDPLTAVLVTGPANGSLALNADGSFTYTPDLNFNGSDSFTYTVNDGTADGNTATVWITVNPVNDPPVAFGADLTVVKNNVLTVDLWGLVNDLETTRADLTFSVGGATNGSVSLLADGHTAQFTPAAGFTGAAGFTYQVTDDGDGSSPPITREPVTINVNVVQPTLSLVIVPGAFREDSGPGAAMARVTRNTGDISGPLTVTLTSSDPSEATLPTSVVIAAGESDLTFLIDAVDDPDVDGTQPVIITASADVGEVITTQATVDVTDNEGPNQTPVANDDSYSVDEDGTLAVQAYAPGSDLPLRLGFDESSSGTGTAYDSGAAPASNGSFNGLATRTGSTPLGASPGALDLTGGTNSNNYVTAGDLDEIDNLTEMTVTLWINLQDAPKHGDMLLSDTHVGTAPAGAREWEFGIVRNHPDQSLAADNFALHFGVSEPGSGGNGKIVNGFSADGEWTFVALTFQEMPFGSETWGRADFWGGDIFSPVSWKDYGTFVTALGGPNNGDLRIGGRADLPNSDLTPPAWLDDIRIYNRPLTEAELDAVRLEGIAQISGGVLANDTDADGDPLSAVLVTGPANGTLALNADGSFVYTPNANFSGTDSFTYRANDGSVESDPAAVTITVNAVNDPPLAATQNVATNEDQAVSGQAATDADGDPLTFTTTAGPANGTVTFASDGTFTYTPDANFAGTDSFSFKASDGTAESDVATVTITVNPVDDPVFAVVDGFATDSGKDGTFSTVDTASSTIRVRLYPDPNIYAPEDRGIFEFSVAGLVDPGITVDSAVFRFQTAGDYGLNDKTIDVYAYAGDGLLTSGDATRAATKVGSVLVPDDSSNRFFVTLDAATIQAIAQGGNYVGLQLRITEASRDAGAYGISIYSTEGAGSLTDYRPALILNTTGAPAPALAVGLNKTSAAENAGAAAVTGTVSRLNADTSSVLEVTLSTGDSTEAVPSTLTVTIAAGQTSANFTIDLVDDSVLDGTQIVTFTASATGYTAGTASLQVTDHEALTVTVVDSEFSESAGPGATTGTVTRNNTDISQPLTVSLRSLNTSAATVPAEVVILAGETSATFSIDAVDDEIVDGGTLTRIQASAAGYVTGEVQIRVTDDDGGRIRPGNILIATEDRYVREYKPDGTLIQTFSITNQGSDLLDLVVNAAGDIEVMNGGAVLTTIDVETGTTQNHTAPNWGTSGPGWSGGIARYGQYIFVADAKNTDPVTGQQTSAGVVRFDTANGYATTRIDMDLSDVADVAIGHDGLLYALNDYHVRVYNPDTLQKVRDLSLQFMTHHALAVNAAGEIYATAMGDAIYKYDSTGRLIDGLVTGYPVKDIDLDGNGRIVASARSTSISRSYVVITDEGFQTVKAFTPTSDLDLFVAFAGPDHAASPQISTSATPAVYTEGDPSVAVDPNLLLTDDGDLITRAVVRIAGNYRPAEDRLSFSSGNGISGSFNTTTGTLTMTGAASVAAYQTALRSVRYSNLSNGPNEAERTITFTAVDEGWSGSAEQIVQIVSIDDGPPVGQSDSHTVSEDGVLTVPLTTSTRLTMTSDPGEWVGQGKSYNLTGGTFSVRLQYGTNGVSLKYQGSTSSDYWDLTFRAPTGESLQAGTYRGANRSGSSGSATLDISGQGRGNNVNLGYFTVHEVAYNASGQLIRFAADFVQHSEAQLPALRGTIDYRATYNTVSGVLKNDTDPDGDRLIAVLVAGPANGALTFNGDGTFTYTPAANFHGTDSFTYKANDGTSDSGLTTVTINVTSVNDPPVANTLTIGTDTGEPVSGQAATDADSDPLTFTLTSAPVNGLVTFAPDGTFTYTPNAGFNGTDSFSFTASDGTATSSQGTVTVNVTPENDPPVAGDDAYATDEDIALVVAAPGVLANDSDADGDSLAAVLVSGPSHGTLVLNPDGWFTYTPALNFNGSDSFTYRADDGIETSDVTTATITVAAVNDAPVAAPDSATTNYATAVTLAVLANDTDVEGDALSIQDVVQPANGSVVINPDNTLTYTPDANFFGQDTFTYRAGDGAAASDPATVTINVRIPAPAVTGVSDDTGSSSTDGITEDNTLVILGTAVPNSAVRVFHDGISIGTAAADAAGNWSFDYTSVILSNRTHRFTAAIVDGSTTGPLSTTFLAVVQAPGTAPLDPTFGQGGLVTTNFQGPSADTIADLTLLQPDGKILAVATTENAIGARDIALTRFNADGTLDTTFGDAGKAVVDFGGSDTARGLALDATGRIVVLGNRVTDPTSRSDVTVARFLADGTLDTSFGDNGVVVTVLSNRLDFAAGVEIDASGRIVVAATADGTFSTDRNVAVLRYLEDGSLDSSFSGDGIATADIRSYSDNDFAQALKIDSTGQIVVLATSDNDFAFARFSDSGNVNSILIANVGGGFATTDRAQDFVIDAGGNYVAVGQSNNRLAVIRFRSSGGLDTSFAGDGSFSTTWHGGLGESATGVIIDSLGNIVVAGRAEQSSFSTDFGLLRLTPDGVLDMSFNGTGKLTVDFDGASDGGGSLAIDAAGRILVGGATRIGTPLSDLALVRLNGDGTFDATFGTGGKLTNDLQGHAHDFGRDAVLQADGKIVALGTQNLEGTNSDLSLARYNPDGSLDTAFGVGGLIVTDFFGGDDHGVSVTLDQSGRILALAQSNKAIAIARYLTDGTLDATFGSGGLLVLQPWSSSVPETIAVDAAGRIVIGGVAFDSASTIGTDFAVVRLNSDGTLDSSFGSGGRATANFGGRFENAADMVIDANGRIILVGNVEPPTGGFSARDIAVAVFTADGILDVSFSSDGMLTTDISGAADFGDTVAVDGTGRILVGGNATNTGGTRDFLLVRYNPDGTLDETFDGDGKLVTDFNGNDFVHDVALDSAGRIIAAGRSGPNSDVYDFSLARYDSSGQLDPSFGISGRATTDFGGTDLGEAVLIDRFDRIVMVGYSGQGATGYDFALARYDADPPAAPVVTGISDDTGASSTDGITQDGTLVILGMAEANSLVEVFRDGLSLGTTAANGSGEWSFDATGTTLPDGAYQITATATDGAGHASGPSPAFSVTIDTVAPAVPVVGGFSEDTGASSGDGITRDTTLVIFGTAAAGSTVEVFLNGASIGTTGANGSGAWSFDHSAVVLADGTYAITARAFDLAGNASSPSAEFTAVINSTVPVANDDVYSLNEDGVLIISAASGVLSNDTDAGGDSLTAVLAAAPSRGSLTLNADGSFTYTPDADFSGTDSFTYRAADGVAEGNTATVTITVNAVNDAPVAADDSASTAAGTAVTIAVLANDADVDGNPLSVSSVTQGTGGSVVINGDGTVTYTPNAGFSGTDSFTYRAGDGTLQSNIATVTVQIAAVSVPQIIDNGDPGFSAVGKWTALAGQGHQSDIDYSARGSGADLARWTFTGLEAGTYRVAATWNPHSNRATDSPFTVLDGTSALGTVRVNQELAPGDFSDAGAAWKLLGEFTITGDTLVVQLSDAADDYVIADAIRIEKLQVGDSLSVTLDTASISENGGTATGTVTRTGDTSQELVVALASSDTTEATLPASVTISVGSSSATFLVTAQDDAQADGTQTVTITASAAGLNDGSAVMEVTDDEPVPQAQIIDNGDPGFSTVGNWTSLAGQGHQSDIDYSTRGSGADVATWTFTGLQAGIYGVAATWNPHANRASDSPFTVLDGTSVLGTVRVNQELAPGDFSDAGAAWKVLGEFTITGDTLVVQLSDAADEYVIADAVRIEKLQAGGSLSVTLDSSSISENGGTATATVTRTGDTSQELVVALASSDATEATTPASVTILAGASSATFLVTAQDDAQADGTHTVTITASASGLNSGSAVMEVTDDEPVPQAQIIDNGDPGFSTAGRWTFLADQGHQSDIVYSARGSGADVATWAFTGLEAGTYRVAATWNPHANRATDSPFTVLDGTSGLGMVRVNQELAPGDFSDAGAAWKVLGEFTITGDTLVVQLSDAADEYVIADAIRIERIGPAPMAGLQFVASASSGSSPSTAALSPPTELSEPQGEDPPQLSPPSVDQAWTDMGAGRPFDTSPAAGDDFARERLWTSLAPDALQAVLEQHQSRPTRGASDGLPDFLLPPGEQPFPGDSNLDRLFAEFDLLDFDLNAL